MYQNQDPKHEVLESIRERLSPARVPKHPPVKPSALRQMKYQAYEASVIDEREYERRHTIPPDAVVSDYQPKENSLRAQEKLCKKRKTMKQICPDCGKQKVNLEAHKRHCIHKNAPAGPVLDKQPRVPCQACGKKVANQDAHRPHCKRR